MTLQALFIGGLNHLLASANWARSRLAPHAGRTATIEMPPFRFVLGVDAEGLFSADTADTPPDVTIRLPADTPLKLPLGLDQVMAEAHVEGNAEFATELSFVFRNLHWDVEEDLSRVVGDIAAHRLVTTAGRIAGWQRQAGAHLAGNLAEYLRHENRLLVSGEEQAALRDAIARLHGDLAALEKRIAALAN